MRLLCLGLLRWSILKQLDCRSRVLLTWVPLLEHFRLIRNCLMYSVSLGVPTSQVRKKLVKHWLPVLLVSKDHSPLLASNKNLCMELEETFLRIISTLPLSDAQELLQQCLSFTRNVDDCPHLFKAFNTWFRRATHPPQPEKLWWKKEPWVVISYPSVLYI